MSATFGRTELESLEYDLESRTYLARFDRATTAASMAVVAALSDVMGVEPTEMEPLGSVVDPEALDRLFSDGATEASAQFQFAGCEVSISADGLVTVERN